MGLVAGKTVASASSAVATMPIMLVAMSEIWRAPCEFVGCYAVHAFCGHVAIRFFGNGLIVALLSIGGKRRMF